MEEERDEEVEDYLTYFNELKDELGINIGGMLHRQISVVEPEDIAIAREKLKEITDDQVYERLSKNQTIKNRYKQKFSEIQEKSEFEVCPKAGESDRSFKERADNIGRNLTAAKVAFLKDKLLNPPTSPSSLSSYTRSPELNPWLGI
jgi:hypothetical protein